MTGASRERGLPPERAGHAPPETLVATRTAVAGFPPPYPPRPGIATQTIQQGGIACLELMPADARRTLLYLHGGGYRMGHPEGWAGFAGVLAERLSARVLLPDYRLAPENPFPAGLNDALAVLAALGDAGRPLLIAGDSAGGGLAAATALAARAGGLAPPDATILISPWLDLSLSGATWESNAERDTLFAPASAAQAADLYLQGHPPTDPLASPLFADLAGFPPSLILAGGAETLLSDATGFAERLALAGTTVEAHLVADMQHTWPALYPALPQTADAVATIEAFVARVTRT